MSRRVAGWAGGRVAGYCLAGWLGWLLPGWLGACCLPGGWWVRECVGGCGRLLCFGGWGGALEGGRLPVEPAGKHEPAGNQVAHSQQASIPARIARRAACGWGGNSRHSSKEGKNAREAGSKQPRQAASNPGRPKNIAGTAANKKMISTGTSPVVPHPSTNPA